MQMGKELRDEQGRIVGYFLTEAEHLKYLYALAWVDYDRQVAEDAANGVVRKWDGKSGLTTQDVLALFQKAGGSGGTNP